MNKNIPWLLYYQTVCKFKEQIAKKGVWLRGKMALNN